MSRRKATQHRLADRTEDRTRILDDGSAHSARIRMLVLVVAVAGIVLASHWSALSAQALIFDDNEYLTDNQLVQHPSWASTERFLAEVRKPSTVKGYYQPLTMISLMLDSAMGGSPDRLTPYHRTSLLLHVVSTTLIIVLLYRLFGSPWVAAIVGLWFGVHPLSVEPIRWVGERKTLLATCFGLGALLAYLQYVRRPQWSSYAGSMALFVLALMSKPTTVPLPLMMLALDVWPLQRLHTGWPRILLEKAPFFVLSGVFAIITVISQQQMELMATHPLSLGQTLLLACHNLVFYPLKMVWPAGLSPFYEFPNPLSASNPWLIAAVVAAVATPILLIASLRWTRAATVGWGCFFVLLLPTLLNKSYSPSVAWDKYVYLPALGLLIALAALLESARRKWIAGPERGAAALAGAAIIALASIVLTQQQAGHWQDTEAIYKRMLSLNPESPVLHYNLGLRRAEQNRFADAVEHYQRAMQTRPDLSDLQNNCGNALARMGRFDEAATYLQRAVQLKPTDAKAYSNLGNVLAELGKPDEAMQNYERALQLNPKLAEVHNNYAVALTKASRLPEAAQHYQMALEAEPSMAEVHNNLASVLDRIGRQDEAVEHYRRAVQIRPDFMEAHRNLGLLLVRRHELEPAIAELQQTLRLQPTDATTQYCLGLALAAAGRHAEAVPHFTEALRADPQNAEIRKHLQTSQQAAGQ